MTTFRCEWKILRQTTYCKIDLVQLRALLLMIQDRGCKSVTMPHTKRSKITGESSNWLVVRLEELGLDELLLVRAESDHVQKALVVHLQIEGVVYCLLFRLPFRIPSPITTESSLITVPSLYTVTFYRNSPPRAMPWTIAHYRSS